MPVRSRRGAGRGQLRCRGRVAEGRLARATTPREFSISHDTILVYRQVAGPTLNRQPRTRRLEHARFKSPDGDPDPWFDGTLPPARRHGHRWCSRIQHPVTGETHVSGARAMLGEGQQVVVSRADDRVRSVRAPRHRRRGPAGGDWRPSTGRAEDGLPAMMLANRPGERPQCRARAHGTLRQLAGVSSARSAREASGEEAPIAEDGSRPRDAGGPTPKSDITARQDRDQGSLPGIESVRDTQARAAAPADHRDLDEPRRHRSGLLCRVRHYGCRRPQDGSPMGHQRTAARDRRRRSRSRA